MEIQKALDKKQNILRGHPRITYSAILPAYCYTPLCLDPTQRRSGLVWKGKHNDYGIGYRY